MTKATDTIKSAADDAQEQLREMREQLDRLMAERVEPTIKMAADTVRDASETVGKLAGDELEMIARQVRERPITALLAAAAVGYVVARLTR